MITKEYQNFFKELESNNNREWFNLNKKRYIEVVREPFLLLVRKAIEELSKFDNSISTEPKNALFRINRDIRFSKDKSPYHLLEKASIAPMGKKSTLPAYYLGLSSEYLHIGGGLFRLDSKSLTNTRNHIYQYSEEFLEIIREQKFVRFFGQITGESSKRIDKKFDSILQKVPEITNKQFVYMSKLPFEVALIEEKLIETIVERYKLVSRLNAFLVKAIL